MIVVDILILFVPLQKCSYDAQRRFNTRKDNSCKRWEQTLSQRE
jgi:hypothetical protein